MRESNMTYTAFDNGNVQYHGECAICNNGYVSSKSCQNLSIKALFKIQIQSCQTVLKTEMYQHFFEFFIQCQIFPSPAQMASIPFLGA